MLSILTPTLVSETPPLVVWSHRSYGCEEFGDTDDGSCALVDTFLRIQAMHMLLNHEKEIGYRSLGPPPEVWIVYLTSCTDSLS